MNGGIDHALTACQDQTNMIMSPDFLSISKPAHRLTIDLPVVADMSRSCLILL